MKTVKEASDILLQKKEITQEEYNYLEKEGAFKIPGMEFLSHIGTATAKGLKDLGPGIKTYAPSIAAIVASGVAAKELLINPLVQKNKINKSYEEMFKKTPQLVGEDQAKIRDYFNVVKEFSPHAAANPLIAGSLVNKMMQFGGVDHKLVQDMAALQEARESESVISHILQGAAKTLTGIPKKD